MVSRRITVFDTTLRDGEQSVGIALTPLQKVRIAVELERLGVDVVEAGFPAASEGDFAAVQEIAREVRTPVIAAMARASTGDIEAAARALAGARRSRIHIVLGSSRIHMERKLELTPDQVLERAAATVAYARERFDEVEFCCEDASRSEHAFVAQVCQVAVEAGADVLNLPDTVGCATPADYARLFVEVRARCPAAARVTLSAHCHDDLGLAVANTLAAIEAGADQVECTVNGLGERAGNAALEEVVAALSAHAAHFDAVTGVDATRVQAVSALVAELTHYPLAPHKAVVGTQTRGRVEAVGRESPGRIARSPAGG
jgi:2-isopropylmalate synthase